MLAFRVRSAWLAPHLACLLLFALLAFVLNRHASGTVVAQGDFYQTTHFALNKFTNLFTWFHHSGQGQYNPLISTFPFYAVQWLLESLGASPSTIADFLVFQFLAMSYAGMALSLRVLRPLKLPGVSRLPVLPLLYALSPVSFLALSYSWGYVHHLLIYWFAPVLFAVCVRLMLTWDARVLLLFVPLSTVATISFSNLGFLAALVLLQGLLATGLLVVGAAPLFSLVRGLIAVVAVELATSTYVWVPFLTSQLGYAAKATSSQAYGGDVTGFLHSTSPGLAKVFGFFLDRYHYPALLPIGHGGSWMRLVVSVATALPFGVLVLSLVRREAPRRLALGLTLTTLAACLLAARVAPPVSRLESAIYGLPGFALLRSPEKLYMLLPAAFALAITALGLPRWFGRKGRTVVGVSVTAALALPFALGWIPAYLDQRLSSDLLTADPAGYSISIRVPESYRRLSDYLNTRPGDGAVVSLPNASVNSPNWGNYPTWGLVGHDMTLLSLRRPYISANIYDHPTLETGLSFQELDLRHGDAPELLALLERFGAQFVLFHRDAETSKLAQSEPTQRALAVLSGQGKLVRRMSVPQFELYELEPTLVNPLVSTPGRVEFRKISPVETQVVVDGVTSKTSLVFRQSHNPAWKLQLLPWAPLQCHPVNNGSPGRADLNWSACPPSNSLSIRTGLLAPFAADAAPDTHELVGNYANGWTLSSDYVRSHFSPRYYHLDADGTLSLRLRLYFIPQSAYYWAALFVLLFNAFALLLLSRRGRKAP